MKSGWLIWLAVCGAIGLLIAVRLSTLHASVGRDAGAYAYGGEHIAQGDVLYRDHWDHKPPFAYYLNAALFSFFPATVTTMAIFEIAWLSVASLLIFAIARHIFAPAGAAAVLFLFVVYAGTTQIIEYVGMTETYALLPVLLAVLAALKYNKTFRAHWLLVSGVAIGLTFLVRQTALTIALPIGLYTIFSLKNKRAAFPVIAKHITAGLAGVALPLAVAVLYFASHGALADFYSRVITYNQHYTGKTSALDSIAALPKQAAVGPLGKHPLLLSLGLTGALAGAFLAARKRTPSSLYTLLLVWLLGDLMAVSLGGRYYAHYWFQPLAVLSLLSGYVFDLPMRRPLPAMAISLGLVTSMLFLSPVNQDLQKSRAALQPKSATYVSGQAIPSESNDQKDQTVTWIMSHTAPTDSVYFWGAEVELNFLTKRKSASRYSVIYPLLVPSYATDEDIRTFISDLERTKPAYIIDTSATNPYVPPIATGEIEPTDEIFDTSKIAPAVNYLRDHYRYETTVGEWQVFHRRE